MARLKMLFTLSPNHPLTHTLTALLAIALLASLADAALIDHWKLDDASGTTATDSAGSNDGTLTNFPGTPTWTTGIIGGALDFDGTNDFINIPDDASLDLTDASFGGWINVDILGSNNPLIDKSNNGSFGNGIHSRVFTANTYRTWVGSVGGGGVDALNSTETVTTNSWHHLMTTFDDSTLELRLFIDGTESSASPKTIGTGLLNNSESLKIGADFFGAFMDGTIDDVAIWDDVLTPAEASAVHSLGTTAGLVYDAANAQDLFTLHDAGSGSTVVEGTTWKFVSGLTTPVGDVTEVDGSFFLRLDISGTGVTDFSAVPEPSSFLLLGLGAFFLTQHTRRNRTGRNACDKI